MIKILFTVLKELTLDLIQKRYGIGNPLGKYKQYGRHSGQVVFPDKRERPWWLVKFACPKGVEPIQWNCETDYNIVDPFTFKACRVYKFGIKINGQRYTPWNELIIE